MSDRLHTALIVVVFAILISIAIPVAVFAWRVLAFGMPLR